MKDQKGVFEGKKMREEASWVQKLTFSYARPLLSKSMKQKIEFKDYGELPANLEMKQRVPLMKKQIDSFLDP